MHYLLSMLEGISKFFRMSVTGLMVATHAHADPVLFEPSDSPFVQTVAACTQDGTLMEVRFLFDLDASYAANHVTHLSALDRIEQTITTGVREVLQPLWTETLSSLNFDDISQQKTQPLQPLLSALYAFTDESFATKESDVVIVQGSDNVMPVLRGGAYEHGHLNCTM